MRELQRQNLVAALEHADWKVSGPGGAAELLGLRPTTLTDRMRAMGIRRPERRGAA
jgi:transcriptional regulator with GAF, ATPase, and Fis domain